MNIEELIDSDNFVAAAAGYGGARPFDHAVVDGFFKPEVAAGLSAEFPGFDDEAWYAYDNIVEVKKACNNWNKFPPLTYNAFAALNSDGFLGLLSKALRLDMELYADAGLNGGGWHIHRKGGRLNPHLDYSLHPKLKQQRKLNLIVYMNPRWQEEWGGSLGFWGNDSAQEPGQLIKKVWPRFNRAVIFDTSQNSWHGLPDPIDCPEGEFRKSLAAYYLCAPADNADTRGKALFALTEEQKQNADEATLEFLRKRSGVDTASSVYKAGV